MRLKISLISSIVGMSTSIFGQNVGINGTGASPDASSILDVSSSDKGMLIPRISLTSVTSASPIVSPAVSLMVYNTATSGVGVNAVSPGFYFWNGSVWERVISGNSISSTDDQNLTGATLSGTNLQIDIENGTSTNVDLASLQDGTGTDSQNLTLAGNSLSISGGNSVTLTDNVNDADFVVGNEYNTGATLSGTTLSVTDGGGAQTVNLSGLQDHDWYKSNTTGQATNISEDIFTNGKVGIGINTPDRNMHIYNDTGDVRIKIVSDPSNSGAGEEWNPAISFYQDGYLLESHIGLIHSSGNKIAFNNPVEGLSPGTNAMLILSNDLGTGGSSAINFGINDTVAMVIGNNRKVGIGVDSPVAQMHIQNNDNQEGIRIANNGYDGDNLNLAIRLDNSGADVGNQGNINIYHSGIPSREGMEFWGYPSNSSPGCCNRIATFKTNGNASFLHNVGIGTTTPNPSARLELNSTNKGFLITRVDTSNIPSPAFGLMTLAPADSCLYLFNGNSWMGMGGGGCCCETNAMANGVIPPPASFPSGTVFCTGSPTQIVDVTSATGRVWMDRNLGATQVATSINDAASYGDLYQWGRFSDGHQCRNSSTTTTIAPNSINNIGNSWYGDFITYNGNWSSGHISTDWTGVNAVNNPCPSGYRVPTRAELSAEHYTWSSQDNAGAFGSALKLPSGGWRDRNSGLLTQVGARGMYWQADPYSGYDWLFFYNTNLTFGGGGPSTFGASVRCIKD